MAAEALQAIHRYLDRYGHQIYTLDFAEPTQGEEPLPILVVLRDLVQEPGNSSRRQAEIAQERERLATNVARSLPPLQRRIFVTLLNWAQKYGPYREDALFYIGAAWPVLRRLAHELGRRLVEDDSLQEPDDIYYLHRAEIESALVVRATSQVRLISKPLLRTGGRCVRPANSSSRRPRYQMCPTRSAPST